MNHSLFSVQECRKSAESLWSQEKYPKSWGACYMVILWQDGSSFNRINKLPASHNVRCFQDLLPQLFLLVLSVHIAMFQRSQDDQEYSYWFERAEAITSKKLSYQNQEEMHNRQEVIIYSFASLLTEKEKDNVFRQKHFHLYHS